MIYKRLPGYIKNDLFSCRNYCDNAISNYRKNDSSFASRIIFRVHRLIKTLTLSGNFLDRKLAKYHLYLIGKKNSKNKNIARNQVFSNSHKGQRCFILGNGPSLKKQDLSLLKDEKTIAINTFWKHPIVKDWQPTYYCFGDGLSFRDQKKYDIEYFNSYTQDKIKQYFHDVRANITNSIFFIPYKNGFEKVSKYNYLPPEKTYYIDYLPLPLFELPPSFPDLTKGLPWVQDSSQLAILIAMAMGFSQIVLLGCDHDWFVEIGKEKHFFNEPVTGQGGGTFDSSKYPMIQCMWFAWVLWRGHDALNKLARQHGVEILNATGGGVLDIYPLASYDNFFNNKT